MRSREPGSDSAASELGLLLAQARREAWYAVARRLGDAGEDVHAWQMLNHLHRLGSVTQSELAVAMASHPAAVSRQLDELERRGWVRRPRSRADLRKRLVALTSAGRSARATLQPHVDAGMDEVLSRLNAGEVDALRRLLRKLVR